MPYSTDLDVMEYLSYVFDLGFSEFRAYHGFAESDIERDIKRLWLPYQAIIPDPTKTAVNSAADNTSYFNASNLTAAQWTRASVFRVLGWYILPRLAAAIGGEGFLSMVAYYKMAYAEEIYAVINDGVEYNYGGSLQKVYVLPQRERQRRIR